MSASPDFPRLPPNWSETFERFENKISIRRWQNSIPRLGRCLFLVHGFGEQSDRYLHFPHFLNGIVDQIVAFDLPGHGKSSGPLGHIEAFQDFEDVALDVFRFVQSQNPSSRWFWLGHSLGGLISIKALQKAPGLPIAGVILSAPFLGLGEPAPYFKDLLGRMILPLLPRLKISAAIDPHFLSREPSVQLEYRKNSLNHSWITPRMYAEMLKAHSEVFADVEKPWTYKTLMMLPNADRIASFPKSFDWSLRKKNSSSVLIKIQIWPGASHEVFNDTCRAQAFECLSEFLNGRT